MEMKGSRRVERDGRAGERKKKMQCEVFMSIIEDFSYNHMDNYNAKPASSCRQISAPPACGWGKGANGFKLVLSYCSQRMDASSVSFRHNLILWHWFMNKIRQGVGYGCEDVGCQSLSV